MSCTYLAFDLETAKVTSRHNWLVDRPLGICCAATCLEGEKDPMLWYGRKRQGDLASQMAVAETRALVEHLEAQVAAGRTIVTWNGTGFDFDVLAEESGMRARCSALALSHIDMMFHLVCHLGFGVSLNAAARGMRLMRSEKRTGSLIPKMWADGRYEGVFNHVARDARITLALATTCRERGFVRWITRWGSGRMLRLPHGWLNVRASQALPNLSPSVRDSRWSRDDITAWMRS
jgi:hypothetical protein